MYDAAAGPGETRILADCMGSSHLAIIGARAVRRNLKLLVAAVFLSGAHATECAAVSFAPKMDFATGVLPTDLAIADLNGDGRLDLAVASSGSDSISVLLGNGDGTFAPRNDSAVGDTPVAVEIGHIDSDSQLDLVVANRNSSNSITLLLGQGAGTFVPAASPSESFGDARGLCLADLNGDGRSDLVVTHGVPHGFSVLLGNGDATFGPSTRYGTFSAPHGACSVAEVSGDGRQDVLVAWDGQVWVHLGNGDGTVQGAIILEQGDGIMSIAVGDVNEDQRPDVVGADEGFDQILVWLGNGDGTFGGATSIGTGRGPHAVAMADLDNDGHLDLAVTSAVSIVSVFLGSGVGTFGSRTDFVTGLSPLALAIADLNADGRLDLAVANRNSNTVSILLNSTPVDVEARDASTKMMLEQNWPNPCRGEANIRFSIGSAGVVSLRIWDARGHAVRTLASSVFERGEHGVQWDGRSDGGVAVPGGVFFYELQARGKRLVKRLTLIR